MRNQIFPFIALASLLLTPARPSPDHRAFRRADPVRVVRVKLSVWSPERKRWETWRASP